MESSRSAAAHAASNPEQVRTRLTPHQSLAHLMRGEPSMARRNSELVQSFPRRIAPMLRHLVDSLAQLLHFNGESDPELLTCIGPQKYYLGILGKISLPVSVSLAGT